MKEIYIDELTHCYNRRFFRYWIDNETKRAKRYGTKFALILLDIDNFRDINNNFGHLEGDKVLIEFTEFLQKNVREVDYVVRYGGDEFLILVLNADAKGIVQLAQRLLASFNRTELLHKKIRCSIGFAVFPDDGTTADALFKHADNLMYQAKRQGKNRVGLKEQIIRKLQIPSPVTIGRDEEANWCLGQLQEYNTVFVAGETGVGKTRLVLEIKDHLDAAIYLRGNAHAALSSVPYHPFLNIFNDLLSKYYNLFQRTFDQLLEIYQSELMKLLPAEGRLKVTPIQGLDNQGSDKYRLYNATTEFIIKMSQMVAPNKTMLLLDDVHWFDQPSCELLDFLVRSINDPIKIFGTYRVEEVTSSQFGKFLSAWAREKLCTQITVPPLNDYQSNQLLKVMVGQVPQSVAKLVYRASGGNPFFIEEIIRELERQQKLYLDGRHWVFVKDLEVAIPSSVEETIKRKVTLLDPGIKRFLEIIAVFGQEFVVDIIAMASEKNIGETLQAFDELRRLGFIKERTAEHFFFTEDIVRQVVYKNMSRVDLIQTHKLIGETIEHFYHGLIANYFEQLAQHFTIAHDTQKALYYSKRAAQKARTNYAHSLSIQFFETALKYETDPEEIFNIKFAMADIRYWTGDYTKAIEDLKLCLEIKPKAYHAYEQMGKVYANMGNYKNTLKCYQQGLKLAQKTEDVYLFRILIARVYWRVNQLIRAKEECEDVLKDINKMKKADIGLAYLTLAVVLMRLDLFEKAKYYLRKSLKIHRELDDKNHIAACYQDLALCFLREFNIKASEDYLKRALDIDEKIGYLGGIVIARINLGALVSDYDLLKAEEYYQKGLESAKLIGAKRHVVLLHNNLGYMYRNRLRDEPALSHYKQSLSLAKEISYDEGMISAHLSLSEYYREEGAPKKGIQHLKAAQCLAEKFETKSLTISCMMEELNYLLASKDAKKLIAVSKKLMVSIKAEHDLTIKIYALIYHAQVMDKLKKYIQAYKYYKRAFNFVKSLPPNRIAGEIFYLRGLAYQNEKKMKNALEMFTQARRMFEVVGHLRYLDKVQKEIEKIPAQ